MSNLHSSCVDSIVVANLRKPQIQQSFKVYFVFDLVKDLVNFYISLCDYNIQFKHIYVCHTLKVSNHILVVEALKMQGENIKIYFEQH